MRFRDAPLGPGSLPSLTANATLAFAVDTVVPAGAVVAVLLPQECLLEQSRARDSDGISETAGLPLARRALGVSTSRRLATGGGSVATRAAATKKGISDAWVSIREGEAALRVE